jgi:N-acetylneuraminic acid mutarotase
MKKKSASQSAFFNLRVLIGLFVFLAGVFLALLGSGAFSNALAQGKDTKDNRSTINQASPGTQTPDVVQMVGPVRTTTDVSHLPYIYNEGEREEGPLTRYPRGTGQAGDYGTSGLAHVQGLLKSMWRPAPTMPAPLLTFDGMSVSETSCGCAPPDTDGDVGPNHYVEALNVAFRVYDKSGNPLTPPTTFNSLFAPLVGTPCSGQNSGDPFVLYDHLADRWLISDFAFAGFPGPGPFYQCIAVSTSGNPAGTYNLYALQHDPTIDWLGDYPKFAMWNSGGAVPQNAYFFTVNLFDGIPSVSFQGVRAYALDRASMIAGGPANAISFLITPVGLGDSYSLVPAYFRTGNAPPAGRDEFLLAVDSPFNENVTLTQVKGWKFHVDFANPANSTLGIGGNHTPNALINVSPFVEAWTNAAGFSIVPQQGTNDKIQTLGDKIMTPVVYQNRGGTESLWADQTVMVTFPAGPSAVRWYQFDVTGGNFGAAVQQQSWSNAGDGLWRFMPSIAVDNAGNAAIGYSVSDETIFPGIRYAGRLVGDPPNNLGQGEATMFSGTGSQLDTVSRWGDYSYTSVDPADGMSFWHANEYYAQTSSFNWRTRIGKFDFVGGGGTPTPTPTASPTPTATPTPACSWSAGANVPSVGVRFVGVYFPANGKFYAMGGRSSDSAGSDFTHPFEYTPGTNTWTTKAATYPDNQVNNMACGVLNDAGTDYIYCVGGSAAGATTATDRVFRYNPVTDIISAINAPWPGDANGTTLPGGFSVFNNKLYTIGGFVINTQMIDDIWEFTPGTNGWVQKASLPVERGYVPATTIGNLIYTAGGSLWDGVTLQDTNDSFVFDPVANTVNPIANIPRATAETRALNFCDTMYVMGGGRTAPNPSNEVNIYDPGSNTWSTGIPFVVARRNFATDTDGTNRIWVAGGYAPATPTDSLEIFSCTVSPCGSPTPTPTPGQIRLRFGAHLRDGFKVVKLNYIGATSPTVDIFRNGALLATANNTGSYVNVLRVRGIYTYKVCEAGTTNCSNEVEVRFSGGP